MGDLLFGKPLSNPKPISRAPIELEISSATREMLAKLDTSRRQSWRRARSGELDHAMGL